MARRKKNAMINIFLALVVVIIVSASGVFFNFEGMQTLFLSFIGGLLIAIALKRSIKKG